MPTYQEKKQNSQRQEDATLKSQNRVSKISIKQPYTDTKEVEQFKQNSTSGKEQPRQLFKIENHHAMQKDYMAKNPEALQLKSNTEEVRRFKENSALGKKQPIEAFKIDYSNKSMMQMQGVKANAGLGGQREVKESEAIQMKSNNEVVQKKGGIKYGAGGSALLGAAYGTSLLPGAGTIAGALLGGAIGALGGGLYDYFQGGQNDNQPQVVNAQQQEQPPLVVNAQQQEQPLPVVNAQQQEQPPPVVNAQQQEQPPPVVNAQQQEQPPPVVNAQQQEQPPPVVNGQQQEQPPPVVNGQQQEQPQPVANAQQPIDTGLLERQFLGVLANEFSTNIIQDMKITVQCVPPKEGSTNQTPTYNVRIKDKNQDKQDEIFTKIPLTEIESVKNYIRFLSDVDHQYIKSKGNPRKKIDMWQDAFANSETAVGKSGDLEFPINNLTFFHLSHEDGQVHVTLNTDVIRTLLGFILEKNKKNYEKQIVFLQNMNIQGNMGSKNLNNNDDNVNQGLSDDKIPNWARKGGKPDFTPIQSTFKELIPEQVHALFGDYAGGNNLHFWSSTYDVEDSISLTNAANNLAQGLNAISHGGDRFGDIVLQQSREVIRASATYFKVKSKDVNFDNLYLKKGEIANYNKLMKIMSYIK